METFELLDRFELLYPSVSQLGDLRRSYIDEDLSSIFRLLNNTVQGDIEDLRKAVLEKNLHSIFRLLNNTVQGDIEDLRKAVLEKNLHSIFRLVEDEDLRKLLLEDNTWKLWPILNRYIDTQFILAFKEFFVNNIKIDTDCFSRGQLQSKLWLVQELKKLDLDLGTVFLCAGWYATLATMLFENNIQVNKIRSFDKDPSCRKIAEIFNKPWVNGDWKFKSSTQDILEINYSQHSYDVLRSDKSVCKLTDSPDTIINTSCEHLLDFVGWYGLIPKGKLVILQANNFHEVEEHVNTYNTVEEFSASTPMTKIFYEGELELDHYTRFMKIGIK